MEVRLVAVSERPDLAPLVAAWRVAAFSHLGTGTVEEATAEILARPVGLEETFVLLEGGRPVGTASFVREDMEARPDLTPWIASVFVEPAARGRGHASMLVQHVEAFARAAGVPSLWLYTPDAEAFYLRLGWERVGTEQEKGYAVVLMRRRLSEPDQAPL